MSASAPAIQVRDFRVVTRVGQLHARLWQPEAMRPNRPPIVLFHDSLGCVELWRDFPEHLAHTAACAVIAYDRLGFGHSDPRHDMPDASFVRDEAGAGFLALRGTLELEDFIALGHSVGGGIAIACANAYPLHCRAVITESAQAFLEARTLQGIRDAERIFSQPAQMKRLEKYHGDKAAWVLRAWVDTWLSPGFRTWHLDDDLRNLRCPVLAIHGDHDEYGSSIHPRRIVELAAGAGTLCILEGCGHVPHRDKQAAVLERIGSWLDQNAS